jgi:hypothetical protein
MTSLNTRPTPLDPSPPAVTRPAASAAVAKEHSDQRFDDRDRREADRTSMLKIRSWTIGAVIAIGTILWLVFTSWS